MSPFREYVQIAYQVNPDVKILRGSGAERKIHEQLRLGLDRNYYIMHNVLLPGVKKHTLSQIDHIVVSKFGIFCIETKAHSGAISANSDRGSFHVRYGKNYYPLINPILQNRGHVATIEYLLGDVIKAPVQPIVVMPNVSSLEIGGYSRDICPDVFLIDRIKYNDKVIYSDSEVTQIRVRLIQANLSDDSQAVNYHHQYIRSHYSIA